MSLARPYATTINTSARLPWQQVTIGMSDDIHGWLSKKAKVRRLAVSELIREILIERYADAAPWNN